MYDWDERKRRLNLLKHGVDFAEVEGFEWGTAAVRPDLRRDYGENRFIAFGTIAGRLHTHFMERFVPEKKNGDSLAETA